MYIISWSILNIVCISWYYHSDAIWVCWSCLFFPLGLSSLSLISSWAWLGFYWTQDTVSEKNTRVKLALKWYSSREDFVSSRRLEPIEVLDYLNSNSRIQMIWIRASTMVKIDVFMAYGSLRYPKQSMESFQDSSTLVELGLQFLSF